MQAEIIKIGNSKGLRIPRTVLTQCRLDKIVDMEVKDGKLIIQAHNDIRKDWHQQFERMAVSGDDQLIDNLDIDHSFDQEWQW